MINKVGLTNIGADKHRTDKLTNISANKHKTDKLTNTSADKHRTDKRRTEKYRCRQT